MQKTEVRGIVPPKERVINKHVKERLTMKLMQYRGVTFDGDTMVQAKKPSSKKAKKRTSSKKTVIRYRGAILEK